MSTADLSFLLAVLSAGRRLLLPDGAAEVRRVLAFDALPPPGEGGVPVQGALAGLASVDARTDPRGRSAYMWVTKYDDTTLYRVRYDGESQIAQAEGSAQAVVADLVSEWNADSDTNTIAVATAVTRQVSGVTQHGVRLRDLTATGRPFDPEATGGTGTIEAQADAESATVDIYVRRAIAIASSRAANAGPAGVESARGWKHVRRLSVGDSEPYAVAAQLSLGGVEAVAAVASDVQGVSGDDGAVELLVHAAITPGIPEGAVT